MVNDDSLAVFEIEVTCFQETNLGNFLCRCFEIDVDSCDALFLVFVEHGDDVGNHVYVDVLVVIRRHPQGMPCLDGKVVPSDVLDVVGTVLGDVRGQNRCERRVGIFVLYKE